MDEKIKNLQDELKILERQIKDLKKINSVIKKLLENYFLNNI